MLNTLVMVGKGIAIVTGITSTAIVCAGAVIGKIGHDKAKALQEEFNGDEIIVDGTDWVIVNE